MRTIKTLKFNVNGKIVECVTIKGLAQMSNRSAIAIRKLIEREILPEANFRGTPSFVNRGENAGKKRDGQRLYTMPLAEAISKFIKTSVTRGRRISERQKLYLKKLFEKEKQLLKI